MWWVGFVTGFFLGAFIGTMLLVLIITAGDDRHGKR